MYSYAEYMAESEEIQVHFEGNNRPPYMMMYNNLAEICAEQYRIIDQSLDAITLASVINHMPKLKAIDITFRSPAPQWLRPLLYRGLILDNEGSFRYHLKTILPALNALGGHTLKFRNLQLPKSFLRRYPHFEHISKSIPHVIRISDAIRYERADMVSSDNWICRSAFGMFLAYHTGSSTPLPVGAILHPSTDNGERGCAFQMWEPGWCVRVQRRASQ
ncbi:hypothetical protein TSTA_084400 [Talaromyces stipitatus ATCC 10500]|uniref:Uncharacterized protein n=1 Tax=Talaromyces stipitatus (strain ATCC 10500 / CBS 375.48 / QM 6759 / NRRL 1006) TaxID=441959 RepID=B8M0B2_TALSN|nr:uncharacterized protein TSTA_084400 [Talaromyces stipitatus ATCC 10500]EED21209.1 hypothetical protein TSTA_084400 [Talaromyces stipitatus ATCC 10500]